MTRKFCEHTYHNLPSVVAYNHFIIKYKRNRLQIVTPKDDLFGYCLSSSYLPPDY